MPGFRIECGAEKTLSCFMGHDRYLATVPVWKICRVYSVADGLLNFHISEIWAKEALGFREPAADFASTTDLGRYNLRLKNHGKVLTHEGILVEKLSPRAARDRAIFLV